jgi:hypothetical protein
MAIIETIVSIAFNIPCSFIGSQNWYYVISHSGEEDDCCPVHSRIFGKVILFLGTSTFPHSLRNSFERIKVLP